MDVYLEREERRYDRALAPRILVTGTNLPDLIPAKSRLPY